MAAFPNHLSQEMALQHFADNHLPDNSSSFLRNDGSSKAASDHRSPTWLNSAILSQPQPHHHEPNFLNLHTNSGSSSPAAANNLQWLSRSNDVQVSGDSMIAPISHESGVIDNCQKGRYKAEIMCHPLYEQLLSAHVACLRIATPVDQLPRIDAQLAQSQQVVDKYSSLGHAANLPDDKELDHFMTHYVVLLCSFKEQLQQHVRVHAMEAVMACWEMEQSLQSITGVSGGEGTGATMSDDDDDMDDDQYQVESDGIGNQLFGDATHDSNSIMTGFGPLIPTDTERSLMESVRQELKHELKNGYKEKIVDIREEILRKRRAGKLPGDTTSVLKAWWQSHSKWPYPTEEDKARLVQETGLQLKQINNWFINQRKRNWHNNSNVSSSSSTALESKRKRV